MAGEEPDGSAGPDEAASASVDADAGTNADADREALSTDYGPLAAEVIEREAAGLVVVGDRFDDDLRWLTRFAGPDRDYAFVLTVGSDGEPETVLCAPALFDDQARREFPGDEVRVDRQGDPAGVRAAAALADANADADGPDDADADGPDDADANAAADRETVLVPRRIPHDAVVYLDEAGYDVASTETVERVRETKTDAELDRLRRVQRAAIRGIRRAERVLAESTVDREADGGAGEVRWNGGPLSTERLRRQVNEVLAAHGVRDAGNTVVGAGPTAADLHYTGLDRIRPGETVLLDVSPRGPDGYYGDVTRTFAVAPDGGWERRAYVACEAAREAALDVLAAGVPASTVHEEAAAELAAHGFRVDSAEVGFTHGVGHGVGVSLHERPSLTGDGELSAGNVVTIEPGVYDPDEGGVRLEDLAVVTDDGYELLGEYPFSLIPRVRE